MSDGPLIKERLPYSGRTHDEVLNSVRTALNIKGVQRIVLDRSVQYIRIERSPEPGETASGPGITLNDAVRRLPEQHLAEYLPDGQRSSYEQLFDMFNMVLEEKLFVTHILTGPKAELYKWVKTPRRSQSLLGVTVYRLEELPNTTIILCGSETRDAEPQDIVFAVKGELP